MEWTTDKPTVAGWYWWRTTAIMTGQQTLQGVVQIEDDGYCREEGDYVSHLGGEWQGPITPDAYAAGLVAGLKECAQQLRDGERLAHSREVANALHGHAHLIERQIEAQAQGGEHGAI